MGRKKKRPLPRRKRLNAAAAAAREQAFLDSLFSDPLADEILPEEPRHRTTFIFENPLDAGRIDAFIDAQARRLPEPLQESLARIRHPPQALPRPDVITVDAFDVPCVVTWAFAIHGPDSLFFDDLENEFFVGGHADDGGVDWEYVGSLAGALRYALEGPLESRRRRRRCSAGMRRRSTVTCTHPIGPNRD